MSASDEATAEGGFTPFGLGELRGQERPIADLLADWRGGRMPHALLIHGPAGCGKSHLARAWAALVLCPRPVESTNGVPEACASPQCPSCAKLLGSGHPDLFRVTVEPKRTQIRVEQVRELIRWNGLTSLTGAHKVAIIDDAALMNASTANALLKTLEEPAGQVLLILVTGRPDDLLPTIRSRTRSVRLAALPMDEVVALLQRQGVGDQARAMADAARGQVPLALRLASGSRWERRQDFLAAVNNLEGRSLAELCAIAEKWSSREAYETVQETLPQCLQGWVRQTAAPGADAARSRRLLALLTWVEERFRTTEVFNLNRQLFLEALLLRLADLFARTGR
ncbi:MAG: DNA polymerase III subunit [Magnetococcus sp. WYHC-3]